MNTLQKSVMPLGAVTALVAFLFGVPLVVFADITYFEYYPHDWTHDVSPFYVDSNEPVNLYGVSMALIEFDDSDIEGGTATFYTSNDCTSGQAFSAPLYHQFGNGAPYATGDAVWNRSSADFTNGGYTQFESVKITLVDSLAAEFDYCIDSAESISLAGEDFFPVIMTDVFAGSSTSTNSEYIFVMATSTLLATFYAQLYLYLCMVFLGSMVLTIWIWQLLVRR